MKGNSFGLYDKVTRKDGFNDWLSGDVIAIVGDKVHVQWTYKKTWIKACRLRLLARFYPDKKTLVVV